MEYLKHKFAIPLILFFVTIVTRLPFTSRLFYDLDSIQFALGTSDYNVTLHQPHPPGYIIYVMLGKLLNTITHDPHTSFLIISIIFSALTVAVVYYFGMELFTKETGLIAAILALTSPSIWFHGEVGLSYIIEAFFSVLTALLCWKVLNGQHKYIYASAIIIALAGGIRQNTVVFLAPLWLFSVRKAPIRMIVISVLMIIAVVSMWFIPMIILSGGLTKYQTAMNELYQRISGTRSVFKIGLLCLKLHVPDLIKFTVYGIGFGGVFLVVHLYSIIKKGEISRLVGMKPLFFIVWLLPSILFYIFIFLHPSNVGYSLTFVPGLVILTAYSLIYCGGLCRKFFNIGKFHDVVIGKPHWVLILIIVFTNIAFFFYVPSYASLPKIRQAEKNVQLVTNYIVENFPPDGVVLLCDDLHFLGFRHVMYYLPEYKAYLTDPVTLPPDRGIFWAENRHTHFSLSISVPKGVRDCLVITHPVLLEKEVSRFKKALSPDGIKLISLSKDLCIIKIDIINAPKVYNKISFVFEGRCNEYSEQ